MAGKITLPRVHVLVLCDDIDVSAVEEEMFDLQGVRTRITAPAFPYDHPQLVVYMQMTGHDGTASCRVAVVNARTDNETFHSGQHEIKFHGPLEFVSVCIWITDCRFSEEGIYYVQVYFDDKLIGERTIFLECDEGAASNGQHPG